jgi:hypothetical protein
VKIINQQMKGFNMSKKIYESLVLLLFTLLLYNTSLIAQDLSAFELVDNISVGLTPAGFSKRGGCMVDIDRNGWPDIYTLKYNGPGYSRLFTNNQGYFTDITHQTPLKQIEDVDGIRTFNVVWVDFDNDGDRDCSFGTNKEIYLLRNDNNVLTDISEETGFIAPKPPGFIIEWHLSVCAWADVDLDGDLDCLVYQYNNKNMYLFRNDDGMFTNIATEAGLDSTHLSVDGFLNPIVFTDWDMDGDPDICGRTDIFANENGVYRDVTEEIGLHEVTIVNHKDFFDYDNDGDLDYLTITGKPDDGYNELYENQGGDFVNVSQETGIINMRDLYRGCSTGDFDNDGDQDIFIQLNIPQSLDALLVNDEVEPGVHVFADVAEFVGITQTGDRIGGGFFDYDKDGFLDLYIHSAEHNHILYHNLGVSGGNWIGLILEGTLSNRDAVGSFIWLYYKSGKKQLRYTKAGSDYLRQDNPWVHFGIGFETEIDSIVIRWPLGYKQVLTGLEINQYHNIKEPDYSAVKLHQASSITPKQIEISQNYPNPFNPKTSINFNLLKTNRVELKIFNSIGQPIRTFKSKIFTSGPHSIEWDGQNDFGDDVVSGIYFYNLKASNPAQSKTGFSETKKMILLR